MGQGSGQITLRAPSNIAFVKYWGKTGRQYPINPSLSMTLSHCASTCRIAYQRRAGGPILASYVFEGTQNQSFQSRVSHYLESITDICPFLNDLSLSIDSENSFPHSAGIASSASAFAAIAYGVAQIKVELGLADAADMPRHASTLARLGSGSAARSIGGPYMIWGQDEGGEGVDDYAVQLPAVHSSFDTVKDAILLIDKKQKDVSSSVGHGLMEGHVYRDARIQQANANFNALLAAMRHGDWDGFGLILEAEALSLHAMMMTSTPSYMLLAPNSLKVMQRVKQFRQETQLPVYFTIDAGPNIHLIYPAQQAQAIEAFITSDLTDLCQDGQMIIDEAGKGAHVIA